MRILVVCLGNICRSPIAEGLFRREIDKRNLSWHIDSAGTGSWHIGEQPDARSVRVCATKGLDISGQRARQVQQADFYAFDLVLAMDHSNYENLIRLKPSDAPVEVMKIMDFVDQDGELEVPDPYYDGRFEEVFQVLDQAVGQCMSALLNGWQSKMNE